ncbi:MAG: class I SAM-dependent methyltransferase [Firmicutes bacterium]|nr:class I SAM-dependent methyltransferase [Bacillota bacterium]
MAGFIKGNALDLGRFADASFDVILNMGPLYHLTEEKDRRRAMEEALRVLKPGGLFFASFISRYAFIVDTLKRDPASIGDFRDIQEQLLVNGINIVSDENPGFTNAYFIHPSDIEPLMEGYGLGRLRLAAVEGFIDPVEPAVNSLPEKLFNRWVDLCYRLGTDPVIWGTSEHMLYVGRKGTP